MGSMEVDVLEEMESEVVNLDGAFQERSDVAREWENEWYDFGRRTLGMAYGRIVVGTKGGHIGSRLHGLLEKVQTMAVFDALAKQRSGSVLGLSCSH